METQCVALEADGVRCVYPSLVWDEQRGGMVCLAHAPIVARPTRSGTRMLDWLTGALTRHVWQEAIVDALDRSQYAHRPCTLLMLDLDHFRTVNDVYGLPSGDETLREIVALMRTALTPDALLFRVSGDEFSSLLQDVDREVARGMAERLRLAVEQHTFPGHVVAAQLTLSIGLSTYPDDVPIYVAAYPKHVESVPGDLEQHRNILIQLCENAIHAAKNMGGNRCFAAHQIDHW